MKHILACDTFRKHKGYSHLDFKYFLLLSLLCFYTRQKRAPYFSFTSLLASYFSLKKLFFGIHILYFFFNEPQKYVFRFSKVSHELVLETLTSLYC